MNTALLFTQLIELSLIPTQSCLWYLKHSYRPSIPVLEPGVLWMWELNPEGYTSLTWKKKKAWHFILKDPYSCNKCNKMMYILLMIIIINGFGFFWDLQCISFLCGCSSTSPCPRHTAFSSFRSLNAIFYSTENINLLKPCAQLNSMGKKYTVFWTEKSWLKFSFYYRSRKNRQATKHTNSFLTEVYKDKNVFSSTCLFLKQFKKPPRILTV